MSRAFVRITCGCVQLGVLAACSAVPAERRALNDQGVQTAGGSGNSSQSQPTNTRVEAKTEANAAAQTPRPETTPRDKLKSGGAIYTVDFPGSYPEKAATHAPSLSISGKTLTVHINHEMLPSSYIQWVQLRTVQGDVLFEREFARPIQPTDASTATFPSLSIDLSGMDLKKAQILYVYSSCGEHGIWREQVKIP